MKIEIKPKNLMIYENCKLKVLGVNLGLDFFFFLLKYVFETLFED